MAELADAIDLGSISKEWEFKSLYPHQKTGQNRGKRFCPVFMFYNLSVLLNFRYASVFPYVSKKLLAFISAVGKYAFNFGNLPTITVAIPGKQPSWKKFKRYSIFSRFKN